MRAEIADIVRSGEPTMLFARRRRDRRAGADRGDAHREGHRRATALRDVPDAARQAERDGPRWSGSATSPRPRPHNSTGHKQLILAGARSPVSFFAYPGKPSDLVPPGCDVHILAEPGQATAALTALADEVAPDATPDLAPPNRPPLPSGGVDGHERRPAVGALLPEDAIVVDESNTAGVTLPAATAGAPRHDWLTLTGGAIGYGLPAAVGAAVAAPDRKVLCLQADGSAMYTPAALWTMAREQLDVTTVIYNNGAYDILRLELQRVGAQADGPPGPRAEALLDLVPPRLDFVALATGMGVPARRATTAEEFTAALADALASSGPQLIDAIIPSLMG